MWRSNTVLLCYWGQLYSIAMFHLSMKTQIFLCRSWGWGHYSHAGELMAGSKCHFNGGENTWHWSQHHIQLQYVCREGLCCGINAVVADICYTGNLIELIRGSQLSVIELHVSCTNLFSTLPSAMEQYYVYKCSVLIQIWHVAILKQQCILSYSA